MALTIDFFMLTREQKKQIIEELVDKLNKQKGVVFFDYTGLKVNEFQELRRELRENKIDCRVIKKSLIDLALAQAKITDIKTRQLPGQIALLLGYEDEVLPAKLLYGFSKKNENVKILAGLVEKDYLDETATMTLAKLPSKQELLTKLVAAVKSPLFGLHYVLQANLQKLLFILKTKSA